MILRDKVKPVKIVKPTISIWNRMFQNKNQNIIYLVANSLYGYAMSRFLTTSGFDSADPKEAIVPKDCFRNWSWIFEKGTWIKYDDYPLAPDKTEIRREMLPSYQLKIAYFHSIPTGNVIHLMPNFLIKKAFASLWKFTTFFIVRIKFKKST